MIPLDNACFIQLSIKNYHGAAWVITRICPGILLRPRAVGCRSLTSASIEVDCETVKLVAWKGRRQRAHAGVGDPSRFFQ